MCQCDKPLPPTNRELTYQVIAAVIILIGLISLDIDFSSMPSWVLVHFY